MFKFRARIGGKFVFGEEAARLYYNNNSKSEFFHTSAVFMLYSGMNDKNNTPIYDGDILKIILDNGIEAKYICRFGITQREFNGNLLDISCFYFENILTGFHAFPIVHNYAGKHDLEMLEIIGNIFDNEDLLK